VLDCPGFESRQARNIFLFSEKSSPALRSSKPPIKYVSGFYPGRLIAQMRMIPRLRMRGVVEASWNVMAYAQKLDFVFRRNGRVHLNRPWGRQFGRLLAAEVFASAVVMLDTPCSGVVWRVLATHSIRQFPFHFPFRTSPCAITFQLHSTSSTPYVFMTCKGVILSVYYPSSSIAYLQFQTDPCPWCGFCCCQSAMDVGPSPVNFDVFFFLYLL